MIWHCQIGPRYHLLYAYLVAVRERLPGLPGRTRFRLLPSRYLPYFLTLSAMEDAQLTPGS
jgi:hypothetical protein